MSRTQTDIDCRSDSNKLAFDPSVTFDVQGRPGDRTNNECSHHVVEVDHDPADQHNRVSGRVKGQCRVIPSCIHLAVGSRPNECCCEARVEDCQGLFRCFLKL